MKMIQDRGVFECMFVVPGRAVCRTAVVAAGLLPMESKFQRLGGIAIHLLDDCVIALNEHSKIRRSIDTNFAPWTGFILV